MNIPGLGRLLILKQDSSIPASQNITFIPLKKTAAGWMIQIGGKIFSATTDRDFIPGVPVNARLLETSSGIQLKLQDKALTTQNNIHPLQQYLMLQGKPLTSVQWEKLQRLWPKTPGRTDPEKAKLLCELEEGNLLSDAILQGFQELLGGGSSEPEYSKHHQKPKLPIQDPENPQEDSNTNFKIEKVQAALDFLAADSKQNQSRWVTIPFRWVLSSGEKKGVARFQVELKTGAVHQWTFSLLHGSWAFLITEVPAKTISVFHPENPGNLERWKMFLIRHFPDRTIHFHPFSDYDGYGRAATHLYRSINEIV